MRALTSGSHARGYALSMRLDGENRAGSAGKVSSGLGILSWQIRATIV